MYTGLLIMNLIDTAERAQQALLEKIGTGKFQPGDVQAYFDLAALKERAKCASEAAKTLSLNQP